LGGLFSQKKIKKYNNYIALDVHKMFAPLDEMCMVVLEEQKILFCSDEIRPSLK